VRKQLKHPEREMLPVGFWVFLGWDIRETRAVWIVSEPIPMIFVQIDRRAVILPHQELHADPWSQISRIHSGGKITLHGRDEGWPTRAGFVRDFSHPGGVRIEMIDWNELTPEKWEAEWQGYKLEVSRLNPGRDPERWYWGIIDRTGADLKLGDPAGEAGSLNEARQEALAAVRRILKSRDQ
jgi:hypothetical protein